MKKRRIAIASFLLIAVLVMVAILVAVIIANNKKFNAEYKLKAAAK